MNHQDVVGNSSSSVGNQRRKKQSKVWEEVTKFTGEDGRDWARCNHCQKVFDGSSKKGTTHLNNHLQRCPRNRNNGGQDADKSMDQTTNLTSSVVIEEKSVIDLIKSYFDENGFLIEDWDPFVLNSRKVEILQVYEEEKEEVIRIFSQLSCRFSLVIELFRAFYLLSIYYIDNSWELKMKTISFYADQDEGDHENCQNLVKNLKESCLDLKINGNICFIINHPDSESGNDFFLGDYEDFIGEINSWFNQRGNSLPFIGFLFNIQKLLFLYYDLEDDLTKWLWNTFGGTRKCIDYVNSTPSNMHNFQITVANAKSMGKKVNISDPLNKNAYNLADFGKAVGYKEAFYERIDFDFKSRSINLTAKEWDEASVIYEHQQELLDSLKSLSENEYTTPNQCFPEFYDLYMKWLQLLQRTQSYHLDQNTSTQLEKLAFALEKYNLVLAIAVIFDPWFTMDIVQLWYNKIYVCDADRYFKRIIHDFSNVYTEYYTKVSESRNATSSYLDAMGKSCTFSP